MNFDELCYLDFSIHSFTFGSKIVIFCSFMPIKTRRTTIFSGKVFWKSRPGMRAYRACISSFSRHGEATKSSMTSLVAMLATSGCSWWDLGRVRSCKLRF